MKFSGESEILGLPSVENLMSGWSQNGEHVENITVGKLILGDVDDSDDSKSPMDDLDLLLTSTTTHEPNNNLAELKPLPPFTGYTGHLSINGISGHHYHTIASAPSPPSLETNNNSSDATNQNTMYYADQVVSSSTMDLDNIKPEPVDYNSLLSNDIEEIAAIISSAIADTTVPNNSNGSSNNPSSSSNNGETSGDSWIDALIDTACGPKVISAESLQELVSGRAFANTGVSGYQQVSVKCEPYMPLLQSRLQNGPKEVYGGGSPSSSTGPYLAHSPPGHVVSTSNLIRYNQVHSSTTSTTPSKRKPKPKPNKVQPTSSTILYSETGSMGKEKPVHRCTICNRGFLNKSNIKVHMRTHTGEKPFRCDVCGKAFRQKAHLIKHAQIHKRIGRD